MWYVKAFPAEVNTFISSHPLPNLINPVVEDHYLAEVLAQAPNDDLWRAVVQWEMLAEHAFAHCSPHQELSYSLHEPLEKLEQAWSAIESAFVAPDQLEKEVEKIPMQHGECLLFTVSLIPNLWRFWV